MIPSEGKQGPIGRLHGGEDSFMILRFTTFLISGNLFNCRPVVLSHVHQTSQPFSSIDRKTLIVDGAVIPHNFDSRPF